MASPNDIQATIIAASPACEPPIQPPVGRRVPGSAAEWLAALPSNSVATEEEPNPFDSDCESDPFPSPGTVIATHRTPQRQPTVFEAQIGIRLSRAVAQDKLSIARPTLETASRKRAAPAKESTARKKVTTPAQSPALPKKKPIVRFLAEITVKIIVWF